MGVGDEHGIDPPEAVLGEPLHGAVQEALPDVYHYRPGAAKPSRQPCARPAEYSEGAGRTGRRLTLARRPSRGRGARQRCCPADHPSWGWIRATRRARQHTLLFFRPSGVSVARQALHGLAPGGAVRQSTCGRVDEVPVPRRMSSTESSRPLIAGESASMDPMSAFWRAQRDGDGGSERGLRARRSGGGELISR